MGPTLPEKESAALDMSMLPGMEMTCRLVTLISRRSSSFICKGGCILLGCPPALHRTRLCQFLLDVQMILVAAPVELG